MRLMLITPPEAMLSKYGRLEINVEKIESFGIIKSLEAEGTAILMDSGETYYDFRTRDEFKLALSKLYVLSTTLVGSAIIATQAADDINMTELNTACEMLKAGLPMSQILGKFLDTRRRLG